MLFILIINRSIELNFSDLNDVLSSKDLIFASVTNRQRLQKGYKNGCHDKDRDFASTKIVPTANIVTSILIS